jgi:hypothetical protein
MMPDPKKGGGERAPGGGARLALAAMGMEAEFSVTLDGQPVRPEDVFGSPPRSCAAT